MAEIHENNNGSKFTVTLNEQEMEYCKFTGELRYELQQNGDPSMSYTTYAEMRSENNIIGQMAEFAFLRLLQMKQIPFSGVCFTITNIEQRRGVLPPLRDFVFEDGTTADIKTDRHPIERYGAVIPVEKLNDIHIADVTIWAQCIKGSPSITFHGWNSREEIAGLRNRPNATRPSGGSMPKPCKRMESHEWRTMESLLNQLSQLASTESKYTIDVVETQSQ